MIPVRAEAAKNIKNAADLMRMNKFILMNFKEIETILETAKTEFIKYAKPLNSEKIDYDKYLELSKDKSLLLRPRWYPAKELWDPFVKEMNTYSFALEC